MIYLLQIDPNSVVPRNRLETHRPLNSPRLLQPLLVLSPDAAPAWERRGVQELTGLLRAARRLCPGSLGSLGLEELGGFMGTSSWGFFMIFVMEKPGDCRLMAGLADHAG